MSSAKIFLDALEEEVRKHLAVNHPLLSRIAHIPFTKEDFLVFGLQHYPLVGRFTSYLEHLLLRAPDSMAKQWLAKVLVDEYGERSDNQDHATHYFHFLKAAGLKPGQEEKVELHYYVTDFIRGHLQMVKEEPFLVGLGAVGPGHEWSIPRMFPLIVRGLRRAGFQENEIEYFTMHMEQDIDHGTWLKEALLKYADTRENQSLIRKGTMLSLGARARFWFGVQEKIVRWRQPKNLHFRPQSLKGKSETLEEMSFTQMKERIPL